MAPALYRTLIASFGRILGLSDVEPDLEGYLGLIFDDLPVHLQCDEEDDMIVAFSRIGIIEEDRREDILSWLLEANLFWQGAKGATLAIEPSADMVFVQNRMRLSNANDEIFQSWLGRFVDVAHYWRDRLEAANNGEAFDPSEEPARRVEEAGVLQFQA